MAKTITATDEHIRLKALFLIVDWSKLNVVSEVFAKENCLLSFVSNGNGTASSDIIDLLGIGVTEKALFLCVVQSTDTPRIIKGVRNVMGIGGVGAGIAFSVPLSGVTARLFTMFEENSKNQIGDNMTNTKEINTMNAIEIKNEMLVSILNSGNSDAFMTEARKAGARGGTVLSARGISQEAIKKFFGISVQDEKEIIIILADKDKTVPIMNAVKTNFGASSKAAGVIFALPVDQVMSLNAL